MPAISDPLQLRVECIQIKEQGLVGKAKPLCAPPTAQPRSTIGNGNGQWLCEVRPDACQPPHRLPLQLVALRDERLERAVLVPPEDGVLRTRLDGTRELERNGTRGGRERIDLYRCEGPVVD